MQTLGAQPMDSHRKLTDDIVFRISGPSCVDREVTALVMYASSSCSAAVHHIYLNCTKLSYC